MRDMTAAAAQMAVNAARGSSLNLTRPKHNTVCDVLAAAAQMAVNAARADLAARGARQLTAKLPGGDAVDCLHAPATPARVKAAIGAFSISELLRAAT